MIEEGGRKEGRRKDLGLFCFCSFLYVCKLRRNYWRVRILDNKERKRKKIGFGEGRR